MKYIVHQVSIYESQFLPSASIQRLISLDFFLFLRHPGLLPDRTLARNALSMTISWITLSQFISFSISNLPSNPFQSILGSYLVYPQLLFPALPLRLVFQSQSQLLCLLFTPRKLCKINAQATLFPLHSSQLLLLWRSGVSIPNPLSFP